VTTTLDSSSRRTQRIAKWASRLAAWANRAVGVVARHWLLLANLAIGLQAFLPMLAPVLMATGHTSAAGWIYKLYTLQCHQLPERSFFLFGQQSTYTLSELERLIGPDVPLRYLGDSTIGYKIAVCQRDVATYLTMLVAGLAFIPFRRRLRPITIRVFVLLCLPIAIDGFGQLVGAWASTPWSRVISGGLFGAACIGLAYPYIESGMRDMRGVMEREQHAQRTGSG